MLKILTIFDYRFLQQVVTFPRKPVTDQKIMALDAMPGYRFLPKGYRFQ
jgi:hypothetical protein